MALQPLAQLRLRLTAWYAATFCGILALLGGGLFLVVRHQLSRPLVAIVVGNNVELQDRYAALIAAFGGAGLAALLLVAAGGWLLVRKSTAPVEATIEHMRRFMADAAHELRTPLTVLRSRAEVTLQQPRDAATYVAALGGIEREAKRLGSIVEDLLILARADAGERP